MSIEQALESFLADGLKSAVDKATKASMFGAGCSVELFDDGNYRVLRDDQIDSKHDSPGLILGIPSSVDYRSAEEEMRHAFQIHWDANQNVQGIISKQ